MNGKLARLLARLIGLSLVSFVAGCATMSGGSLQKSSARLEDQTREFYSELRAQPAEAQKDATEVSRAAEALIISSRDFNRAVERRATSEQMLTEFDRVARDYKNLSQSLTKEAHGGRNEAQAQKFEQVTEAYKAVEESMPTKQASVQRISMTPAQTANLTEIERRTKLKDYWFP